MPLLSPFPPPSPSPSEESTEEEDDEGSTEEETDEEDEDFVVPLPPIRASAIPARARRLLLEFEQQEPTFQIIDEEAEAEAEAEAEENSDEDEEEEEEEGEGQGDRDRRREEGEASSSSPPKRIETEGGTQSTGNESEGVSCPICMESWSSEGGHQISCLPCGHLYGLSCIERWIREKRNNAKCPQCSKKCKPKDIIKLYVSRILVTDGEQEKKLQSLQAENDFLKIKVKCLENVSSGDLQRRASEFIARTGYSQGQRQSGDLQRRASDFTARTGYTQGQRQSDIYAGHALGLNFGSQGSPCCNFELEDELVVEGARIFDIDATNRILILARRLPGMGGSHVLTKIGLVYPYESENIELPPSTKAVKDLHVSPSSGRLALFASLGKKLSILSMDSNNIVLTYELPVPAWSCSWDLNSSHHIYAGLQNGMLLVFDIRQTARPVESINGLTGHPVHTIHSVMHKSPTPSGVRTLLSASSIGPCVWNTGGVEERPFLVPNMENQGVCISLAYSPSSDDMVASFRPKIQTSNDIASSQSSQLSPSPSVHGRGILGSHVIFRRVGGNYYQNLGSTSAQVNDVRMPKSALVKIDGFNPLLAYGDEAIYGLSLRELPSLRVLQRLRPHQHPILDVKYAPSLGRGILGCTSEDRLQIFSARNS